MSALGCYVQAHLHRRIFLWFGASILLTGLVVGVLSNIVGGGRAQWRRELDRVHLLVGGQFEHVWDTPSERDWLARAIAQDLETEVTLTDADQNIIVNVGGPCKKTILIAPVLRHGRPLGSVLICAERHQAHSVWRFFFPFLICMGMLWAASRRIAWRLSKPLVELARVAQDIGSGKLSSRVRLGRREGHGEVTVLAKVINEMAMRIEKQMADQRELLAAVSHEIRTPLARIRLLTELVREQGADGKKLGELDQEVMEIDELISDLLANSRLDFAALTTSQLDAIEVAQRALERAGVEPSALVRDIEPTQLAFYADATLIARALANLIENTKKHADGVKALRIYTQGDQIGFEVSDDGHGFEAGEEDLIFKPFYRNKKSDQRDLKSIGLGLSLVQRIAQAHGGIAYAANKTGGGACVGFLIPRLPDKNT